MNLFRNPEIIDRYMKEHSSGEDPVLAELARHTFLKEVHPNMLSGHIMGSFLTLFSRIVAPAHILEIGTYTGYSAICLAKGLKPGGRLTTLEVNDELRHVALTFFRKAGVDDRIEIINGEALKIIPELHDTYDLVFLDANKEAYPAYYDLILERVPSGGYILADNVLWGGKVLDNPDADSTTSAIHRFNQKVVEDNRVENILLPIRDGLMIIQKQ